MFEAQTALLETGEEPDLNAGKEPSDEEDNADEVACCLLPCVQPWASALSVTAPCCCFVVAAGRW